MRSRRKRPLAVRIDWLIILLYVILVAIGIASIYSVQYTSIGEPFFDFSKSHMRQTLWFGISIVIGVIILMTESKFFYSTSYLLYFFGILLLLATFVIGSDVKGSHSFIKLGSFSFQPGEICKVFTALAIAHFITTSNHHFKTIKERTIAIILIFIPLILILLENETGLALVYIAFFIPLFREGLPGSIVLAGLFLIALFISSLLILPQPLFLILTGIAILAILIKITKFRNNKFYFVVVALLWLGSVLFANVLVPYTMKNVFHGYQVERIYSMLGQSVPDEYVVNGTGQKNYSDYNVRQSKIAIGSGGLLGKGFMQGTQTKYSFVPEQSTDFIFCSVGEQFGFVGSSCLIILYLILLLRIVFVAERQRSRFSRVYAYSVAAILFFHLAINIGMTVGLMPVIGITLPMISYGGTSLLSFSIMLFILLRFDADRKMLIQ